MAKNNGELLTKIQNGAAAPAKPVTQSDAIAAYLRRPEVQREIATALPKHITSERLARVVLTTIRLNPKLAECNMPSLMAAIMQSAALGLEPGVLGHAYLVPYGKEVQFQIGYKGLVELMMRTGRYEIIDAEVVRSKDVFVWKKGYEDKLEHEPNLNEQGEVVAVYAFFKLLNGGRRSVVLSKADVEKVRKRSKAGGSGPWVTDWEEMAKKTALRRLSKIAPLSIEVQEAFAEDEAREFSGATEITLNAVPDSAPAAPPAPAITHEVFPDEPPLYEGGTEPPEDYGPEFELER